MFKQVISTLVIFFLFWGVTQGIYSGGVDDVTFEHQFTTALVGENPVDDIQIISNEAPALFHYTKYKNLSLFGKYESVCKIFDDKGTQIFDAAFNFLAKSSEWYVGCWVIPSKLWNGSSNWMFKVELNGKEMYQSTIELAASNNAIQPGQPPASASR